MGNPRHDWPKTKVKGGWGAFYRKQQVEKKAGGSDRVRFPDEGAICPKDL
jgi:hypothetical protein